jgi:bifunctional non-homologous end joining protein LigD
VRPTVDARVSTPLSWDEVAAVDAAAFTIDTVPERVRRQGDPAASIDDQAGSLEGLLELVRRDEERGEGDAPWPPHYAKGAEEPPRVAPSRRRKTS